MRFVERRRAGHSLAWALISLLAVTAPSGCNKAGGPRPDQIEQVARLPNKVPVAKFAGHVSVDGLAPAPDRGTLFVILNDPQHLVAGGKATTTCDEEGNFVFTTYVEGDGAPTGQYVLSFAQLKIDSGQSGAGRGRRMGGIAMSREYAGSDGLNNLYSDPEKNKDDAKFAVDIADPGRTDYAFTLEVAGKNPVKTPGPFAARRLRSSISPKL